MFDRHAAQLPEDETAAAYPDAMTVSAHDVAAVLRERLPGLPKKKLHKLLYYCQGHHLATFGQPLFRETISAWDMGPVVGQLWKQEQQGDAPAGETPLTEAHLNTIGYVLSRYGRRTGLDLEHDTHSEAPWQLADRDRRPGESARIELAWIQDYFSTEGAPTADEPDVDPGAVATWLRDAPTRRAKSARPDDPEEIRLRLASAQ